MLFKQYLVLSIISCLGFVHEISGQSLKERKAIAEGNNNYLQENYRAAISNYSKVLSTNAKDIKANFNIGNAFYETKQYLKAKEHYLKVVENTADSKQKAEAYYNIGNCFMKEHKYPNAIESYKNALRNNPKDNQARYNLTLARKLNQTDKKNSKDNELKPSDYVKNKKEESEKVAKKGDFISAYKIMGEALAKDSSALYESDYLKKLQEIIILDTIE
ncbi:tetratricopeptide repeat protein [Weeksellaceae bacterium TAE3-ERU29]|nr:tetratricopeptide repeat protein [Weeksellaceae bacterium TAE3-ERU29]